MIRARHIHSLNEFRQHASAHLERLAETGEPLVLTVNGEARGVVLSPEAFDRLADAARLVEVGREVRRRLESVRRGEGVDASEDVRWLAAELGYPIDE